MIYTKVKMKSFELLLTILFISIIYLSMREHSGLYIIGICSLLFVTVLFSNNVDDNLINNGYPINNGCPFVEGLQNKTHLNSSQVIESTQPVNTIQTNHIDDIIKNKVLKAHSQSKKLSNPTDQPIEQTTEKKPKLKPISERPNQLEYSENNYKYNIFDEIGSLGDNKLAHLQKHISNKNRVAIDNMARQNKYTNINYFAEELNEHANSIWWDDETLEKEF